MTTRTHDHHHHHQQQQQQQRQQQQQQQTNGDPHSLHHHRPYAPPHHHYLTSSSSAASFKGCCCCLFLLLTLLALLAIAAALVIVLAIKPKKPQFDLQQVAVQYLLVAPSSQPPSGSAYLSLNITLLFTAENPNKVEIRYDSASFPVMYRGVPLGVATVPAFDQPAHSSRLVVSRVAVARVDVMQADALELIRDATVNDRVELRVAGDVGAKIRFLGLTSPRVQVSVVCAIVISPRRQAVTYKQCGVEGVNV